MDIGRRIKELRKNEGLTQIEFADKAGIAVNSLRLYESGKRQPRLDQLGKIASALNVTVSYLTNGHRPLGIKVKKWTSNKSAHIEISIDSELLRLLGLFAKEDGLSLEDEIEKILYEESECRFEKETCMTEDVTGKK